MRICRLGKREKEHIEIRIYTTQNEKERRVKREKHKNDEKITPASREEIE